jgi:hypothetical protein
MKNLIRRLLARPLLTDVERELEFDALSTDDCGHLVAFFASQFPAEFDAGVAALGSYRHEIEEAA